MHVDYTLLRYVHLALYLIHAIEISVCNKTFFNMETHLLGPVLLTILCSLFRASHQTNFHPKISTKQTENTISKQNILDNLY